MPSPSVALKYRPSPQPSGGMESIRVWCQREFERISNAINEGATESIRMDLLKQLPKKPYEGLICYFRAGTVGVPSKGVYVYDGSGWVKL